MATKNNILSVNSRVNVLIEEANNCPYKINMNDLHNFVCNIVKVSDEYQLETIENVLNIEEINDKRYWVSYGIP